MKKYHYFVSYTHGPFASCENVEMIQEKEITSIFDIVEIEKTLQNRIGDKPTIVNFILLKVEEAKE